MKFIGWAEEHWEAVSVMVSMLCALTVAITLAITFNVISTRPDRLQHDAASAALPSYNERSETRGGSGSVI